MRTIEEFEVTRQLLGNLAIEGDFYDTLGEALWAYDRECATLEGSGARGGLPPALRERLRR